jgi:membrane protease YdiL (CAAX protease family)
MSYGLPETDAQRQSVVGRGHGAFIALGVIMVGVVFALMAGFVLLMVGLVLGLSGKMRPAIARPRTGSPLWLETFAVFVGGFLLLQLIMAAIEMTAPKGATWPLWANLLGQWGLALLVFWPVVRGMSAERFRGEIGWHRGRGFFREVGAGVLAYLAALPIYFGVAFIVVAATLAYREISGLEDPPPMPDNNKVIELFSKGGPGIAILLASLVVLWAPLVEETMFRGALYRAVRSPLGAVGAGLLTAAFFAVMHAYAPVQLILVGTLGVVFAYMREWRGSLIPSMTAHCLHNSIVLSVMLIMLQLAGN